jgi:hypothetical protein
MGTLKGSAAAVNMLGITGILVGLVMLVSMAAGTEAAVALLGPLIFLLFGVSVLGYNALALPRWAAEREEQMEYIAGRAQALIGPAAEEQDPGA